MFLAPTYINIIVIYSMANLHDISWGNRVTDQKNHADTQRSLEVFRAIYLVIWITLNFIYGYAIIIINRTNQETFILILTVSTSPLYDFSFSFVI